MLQGLQRFQEYQAQRQTLPRPRGFLDKLSDVAQASMEGVLKMQDIQARVQQMQAAKQQGLMEDIRSAASTGSGAELHPFAISTLSEQMAKGKKPDDIITKAIQDLASVDQTDETKKKADEYDKALTGKSIFDYFRKKKLANDILKQQAKDAFNEMVKKYQEGGGGDRGKKIPPNVSPDILQEIRAKCGDWARMGIESELIQTIKENAVKVKNVEGGGRVTVIDWENPKVREIEDTSFSDPQKNAENLDSMVQSAIDREEIILTGDAKNNDGKIKDYIESHISNLPEKYRKQTREKYYILVSSKKKK